MRIIADTHCHTIASTHAYSTWMENIHAAKEAGLGDDRYLFDIGKPSMLPFLSYSPRRDLRQEL